MCTTTSKGPGCESVGVHDTAENVDDSDCRCARCGLLELCKCSQATLDRDNSLPQANERKCNKPLMVSNDIRHLCCQAPRRPTMTPHMLQVSAFAMRGSDHRWSNGPQGCQKAAVIKNGRHHTRRRNGTVLIYALHVIGEAPNMRASHHRWCYRPSSC